MNLSNSPQWLKSNWYVLLLVLAIVATVVSGCGSRTGEEGAAPTAQQTGVDSQTALRSEFERAKAQSAAHEESGAGEKSTDAVIAEHTQKLEQNPEPDEAAALLSALGNLHRQKKQDYAAAARYYEQLIESYPDWPGINGVYHQLMTCYSRLEDQESLRRLYRKMLEVFPADSKEYEYAKNALGE